MSILTHLVATFSGILCALSQLTLILLALLIPFTIGVSVVVMPVPVFFWALAMALARSVQNAPGLSPRARKITIYVQSGFHRILDRLPYPALWPLAFSVLVLLMMVGMFFLFRKN